MKYPLVGLTISFCLGILLAAYFQPPFSVLYLLAFFVLIISLVFIKSGLRFDILLLCLAFFLGAALLINSQLLSKYHIANFTPRQSKSVSLSGVIDNDPVYKSRNASFILKAQAIKVGGVWERTGGKVLVKIFEQKEFSYGDRLLLEGRLYRPFSFSPEFNYRNYLGHQGIYSILNVKKGGTVEYLGKDKGNLLKSFAFKMRHRMREVIVKNLSPFSASILNAIILGEKENLPADARGALVKSGSVHIIAISGLHLGIVAFIILVVLKIMRVPPRPRYVITIFFLILYAVLTGARPPVVRATIMAVVLLVGYFLEREVNVYSSLSLAALIILALNPGQLFEVGFQLSFLSVLSIVYLTPRIKSLFPARASEIASLRFLILTFSVSAAAWLGLLPLIARSFRIISPVTVLANMLIVPYLSLIVASGFTLALGGILIPFAAPLFAASCELFILILFKLNSLLISLPGAYFKLAAMPLYLLLLYYALLVCIFNLSTIPSAVNYLKGKFAGRAFV